jgi:DNA-binding NarL/FixJ family response regulator
LLSLLGRKQTTKIIVKTSRQDGRFLEQVNQFGIDTIILKPISEDELIKTVQTTLSRKGSAGATAGSAA